MKASEDKMLDAVAKFLKERGWNVVVIGGASVQQPVGSYEANYEFVVRFTGGKRADKPARKARLEAPKRKKRKARKA